MNDKDFWTKTKIEWNLRDTFERFGIKTVLPNPCREFVLSRH